MKKKINAQVGRRFAALESYKQVLAFLKEGSGVAKPFDLPFIKGNGVENLFLSLSAAAPAVPGANNEEWNPLSQRPHTALPPAVKDGELGADITALKEAIEAFTTLSHEMMHIALWEPFFAGFWQPRSQRSYRDFSLMAEGFCFFFSDIVVSSAVRVRLPDGEFALDRQTPSNARFHPIRAFQALNICDQEEILDIYLDGFSGSKTKLWQSRGVSPFSSALASQVYEFYEGSQRYLDELHTATSAFGGLTEFYQRFCAISGLPTFLDEKHAKKSGGKELKPYFFEFFRSALKNLAKLSTAQVEAVRWRRLLQMRAYYVMQVKWLLSEDLHVLLAGRPWPKAQRRELLASIDIYLDGLEQLLQELAGHPERSPLKTLAKLDADYDKKVRRQFLENDAWVGERWLIAPRRAGGRMSVFSVSKESRANDRQGKVKLLQVVAFLIDELTSRMRASRTIEERSEVLKHIQKISAFGAVGGSGTTAQSKKSARQLCSHLAQPYLMEIWSVPLAGFNPLANEYRELIFSYQ